MKRSIILLASAMAILSTPVMAQEAEQDPQEDTPNCVQLRNINGYSVIDNQHLVLRGGVSHYYLVTTTTRCSGMRFGVEIGTSFDDNARLCRPFVEYIIPDDGWRCAIETVEEVESEEAARELVAQRAESENGSDP